MYEITVEDTFDAAHCLPENEGACRRLHGHTYRVQVSFRTAKLSEAGIAIDFRTAKLAMQAAIEPLDHQYINQLPDFEAQAATAENIARFIFDRIAPVQPEVWSVSVWETPTSCATYCRDAAT